MIWGYLLHLGVNMWSDVPLDPGTRRVRGKARFVDELFVDKPLWDELTEEMANAGFNMVVIDLGDAVRYESHPEIAVRGAWSTDQLRAELDRLRGLGLEPIPKLNFSAAHDAWLGEYARQVSTPIYYKVAADLIAEVADLFDQPRFFHLGMDEENFEHQSQFEIAIVRHKNLWWRDLNYLLDQVRGAGSRPWVWSDPAWHDPEFHRLMPKDVVQSNWYYQLWFEADESNRPRVLLPQEHHLTYLDLDDHGFDQLPTASSWRNAWDNFELTVEFCTRRLDPERLLGFIQAPWLMTVPEHRAEHLRTIEVSGRAIRQHQRAGSAPRTGANSD